jgi:hypothetical protein
MSDQVLNAPLRVIVEINEFQKLIIIKERTNMGDLIKWLNRRFPDNEWSSYNVTSMVNSFPVYQVQSPMLNVPEPYVTCESKTLI